MVYLILCPNKNAVKIGYGEDPEKRLKALQTGCPDLMFIIAVMNGDREREKWLHSRFQEYRIQGEWFRVEGEMRFAVETRIHYLHEGQSWDL